MLPKPVITDQERELGAMGGGRNVGLTKVSDPVDLLREVQVGLLGGP